MPQACLIDAISGRQCPRHHIQLQIYNNLTITAKHRKLIKQCYRTRGPGNATNAAEI